MQEDQILKKVEVLAKPTYDKLKVWAHGWLHVVNVVDAAEKIARAEKADIVACKIAAYCHDLGRLEEEKRGLVNTNPGSPSSHAILGVKPTEKILDEVGISGKTRDQIIEAVKLHNIRKYKGDNKILTILQDADRVDGFSKLAILRFAAFNLELPINPPKNKKDIDREFSLIDKQLEGDVEKSRKMIKVLDFAVSWYEDLMNLKSTAIICRNGYVFVRDYRQHLVNSLT
jgi:HD superfamily phosphodiesterase